LPKGRTIFESDDGPPSEGSCRYAALANQIGRALQFEANTSFNMLEHRCDATFVPPIGDWGHPSRLDPVR